MRKSDFLFLATGGTIEFVPDQQEIIAFGDFKTTYQKPNFRQHSIISAHLERHFPDLGYNFQQICMKDGKDIKTTDLLAIECAISASACPYVIITHGTDTMVENARTIDKWIKGGNKTVIFVGAFRPLEEGMSDGAANIKLAIENAATLPSGVYISGSGYVAECKTIVKDFGRGEFARY